MDQEEVRFPPAGWAVSSTYFIGKELVKVTVGSPYVKRTTRQVKTTMWNSCWTCWFGIEGQF